MVCKIVLEAERLNNAIKPIQVLSHNFVLPLEHGEVFLALMLLTGLHYERPTRNNILGIVDVALTPLS